MPSQDKKELQAFIGIINYLRQFSPSTADIFDKTRSVIKEDAYMKFYYETKPLYIETDSSEVELGAIQLQKEVAKVTTEMKHQTIAYSDPLHL